MRVGDISICQVPFESGVRLFMVINVLQIFKRVEIAL